MIFDVDKVRDAHNSSGVNDQWSRTGSSGDNYLDKRGFWLGACDACVECSDQMRLKHLSLFTMRLRMTVGFIQIWDLVRRPPGWSTFKYGSTPRLRSNGKIFDEYFLFFVFGEIFMLYIFCEYLHIKLVLDIILKTIVMIKFDDRQNSSIAFTRRGHISLLYASTTVESNYGDIHT